MAATPIAIPSADRAARSFRVRKTDAGKPGEVARSEPRRDEDDGALARYSLPTATPVPRCRCRRTAVVAGRGRRRHRCRRGRARRAAR